MREAALTVSGGKALPGKGAANADVLRQKATGLLGEQQGQSKGEAWQRTQ